MNNTQNTNEHTEEEYRDTVIKLSNALNKLVNEYNGDPEKCRITSNKNGSYDIFIDDKPLLWFQDEIELGAWVLGMNNNDN